MAKVYRVAFGSLLILAMGLAVPAWGRIPAVKAITHKVTLSEVSLVNGVALDPGRYKVVVNGSGETVFYQGSQLVASAPAYVRPLQNGACNPNSIVYREGNIEEIRTHDQVIVFGQNPSHAVRGGN